MFHMKAYCSSDVRHATKLRIYNEYRSEEKSSDGLGFAEWLRAIENYRDTVEEIQHMKRQFLKDLGNPPDDSCNVWGECRAPHVCPLGQYQEKEWRIIDDAAYQLKGCNEWNINHIADVAQSLDSIVVDQVDDSGECQRI